MRPALSAPAKLLLSNARNLSDAAEFLASGQSAFGEWCIPSLLPKQGCATLYAASGVGKTFIALHLGLSKAAGLDWFGTSMLSGTVVFLVTEDRSGVEARAVAAAEHMQLALGDVPFEILTPPAIHSDHWGAALIEALTEIRGRNELPIAAVFLDTLGAAFGGRSQDDAAQMTLATDAMQAISEHFKCLFVALHHAGKNEERGMRGSQVLKDRMDTVLTLNKSKGGLLAMSVEKQRNGASSAPLSFRLEPVPISIGNSRTETTCIVADLRAVSTAAGNVPIDDKPALLSSDVKTVFDVIRTAGEPITVRKLKILTEDKLMAVKKRSQRAISQAVSDAKKKLLRNGYIEFDPESETVRICQKTSELQIF